ncbi:glutamate-5-semialdehyde dehydrogenase [Serinibacter salmoneus]|uniref:Gamma-glutamyl phosphate reductase n=1 Tax=Serinibacter salmoneus TaxID=556530 RepID=A0A2A9D093_9MICO|nr:glutamate-5-semialdehyde dehydrogenase [Serinibacter salmoneus]PFG20107.1 glutamate-5-semialdehyde dehydrogenase [Serinibacter salmoneus]
MSTQHTSQAEYTAAAATADSPPQASESEVREGVHAIARQAKVAARALAAATGEQKNAALLAIADALVAHAPQILTANAQDVERESAAGMSAGLVDRLRLDEARIAGIADALREVAALADPVGEVVRGQSLPNGLRVRQTRVPLGVVGVIYEARPNVTVDVAGLALKSGNAVVLRGGSAAARSNEAIIAVLREALAAQGLPADLVTSVDAYGRPGGVELMRARGLVDVVVPRGGASLIQTVVEQSTVPVIETGVGNCHLYVDAGADVAQAVAILMNGKTQRVGVCNALETLLVHRDAAAEFLPAALAALAGADVTLHTDDVAASYAPEGARVVPATAEDWATEYLSLDIAVRVVGDMEAALEHIRTYSSGHTEVICTPSIAAARRFTQGVDSAAVMVNASSRFTDGGQLGLGAELGISTQKLHARGPMGLAELTTTTWVVEGDGHIRP